MKLYDPFSRIQAEAMKAAFCGHIGTKTNRLDFVEVVEHIAVAPYDELNQWFYFNFFLELEDPIEALWFYKGDAFDLLFLLKMLHNDGTSTYEYLTMDQYLHRGIAEKIPGQALEFQAGLEQTIII